MQNSIIILTFTRVKKLLSSFVTIYHLFCIPNHCYCIRLYHYHFAYLFSYRGKPTDTLSSLSYGMFMESVAKSKNSHHENLPPTEHALTFHAHHSRLWSSGTMEIIMTPLMTNREAVPERLTIHYMQM